MTTRTLKISVLPGNFAVCRLGPDDPIPDWIKPGLFVNVTRTADELSVVCEEDVVPADVVAVKGWACLKVEGPFDFSEVGVIASISRILAESEISLLSLSTFETDYILLKWNQVEAAVEALKAGGHSVTS